MLDILWKTDYALLDYFKSILPLSSRKNVAKIYCKYFLLSSSINLEKIVFKVHALNIIIAYPFQCKRRVFKSNNMPSCRFGIWSFLIVMYFNFYKTKNFKEAVINTLWNNNSYVNNTLYFVFNNLYCTTMIKIVRI